MACSLIVVCYSTAYALAVTDADRQVLGATFVVALLCVILGTWFSRDKRK